MPATPHIEKHFTAGETIRDIVIGMSDGLTVPFALAAGLSGAVDSASIILTAGFAEVAAGSIAMGLGGYLAARSDAEHYQSELEREHREVGDLPETEKEEVAEIFRGYGLEEANVESIVKALSRDPKNWVEFMMKYELGLEKPDPRRAMTSALTIAGAYVFGGIIPLAPYMALAHAGTALLVSVIVTMAALFAFGFVKGRFTGVNPMRSALQTLLIGSLAAATAFGIARLLSD